MNRVAELKKTEETSRVTKIYLKDEIKLDSSGVDFNFLGLVPCGDFVERVQYPILGGSVVILSSDVQLSPELVITSNYQECVKLYKDDRNYQLVRVDHIEKIEMVITEKITLTP